MDVGDLAGVMFGSYVANGTAKTVRQLRPTDDPLIDTILGVGVGLVVGTAAGNVVDSAFDNIFGGD